ncbi:MAG: Hsp70 family protein [Oscillospiraceae bacterium]
MSKHYGFDLGDAESAISIKSRESASEPEIVAVDGVKSFITAFAVTRIGEVLVGENACYSPRASEARLRFKSRFLTDKGSREDVLKFIKGVLRALYTEGSLRPGDECDFYIGCPAGWDADARESYRSLFESAGYPPSKIITESRAALMSACQSKHLQVSYDILAKPLLVVDIGSSTTDFAYILGGREVELQTSGEVFLGGGIMDEILLSHAVEGSPKADRLREVFEQSSPWRCYCEFAARRLKERYFSDEEYWSERGCTQSIVVRYRMPIKLTLTLNAAMADALQNEKVERLGGRSFTEVFTSALCEVRDKTKGDPPEILFLTGGVSKMPAVRTICRALFPDAIVVLGIEPEFSVSKGLAWTGAVDEEMKLFKKEIDDLVESDTVEDIVDSGIDELFRTVVDVLVEPILKNAAVPVFLRWRSGEIEKLNDIDAEMTEMISVYLRSDEVKTLLCTPIARWMKPIAARIEERTIPICVRHGVPYTALSLSGGLSVDDLDVRVDARSIFAVDEITWLINAIVSVLVGLLCGGGGIALIAGGLPGVIAGAAVSLLILFLGKEAVQGAVLSADIPLFLRKVIPQKFFDSRTEQVEEKVREQFYDNLNDAHGDEIRDQLVDEISGEIERCLTQMAEVVEIPLG